MQTIIRKYIEKLDPIFKDIAYDYVKHGVEGEAENFAEIVRNIDNIVKRDATASEVYVMIEELAEWNFDGNRFFITSLDSEINVILGLLDVLTEIENEGRE